MSEPLKAGRELDALIAARVMGWTVYEEYVMGWASHGGSMMQLYQGPGLPRADGSLWSVEAFKPSTDIAAAWEVVGKIREMRRAANELLAAGCIDGDDTPSGEIYDHVAFVLELSPDCSQWEVNIYDPPSMYATGIKADTAPLAICLAALRAVRARPTEQETR
jgi:ABA sandwich protein